MKLQKCADRYIQDNYQHSNCRRFSNGYTFVILPFKLSMFDHYRQSTTINVQIVDVPAINVPAIDVPATDVPAIDVLAIDVETLLQSNSLLIDTS